MIPPKRIPFTKKLTWSKNGWIKSNNPGHISARNNVFPDISNIEEIRTGCAEVDMFLKARSKIQIGSCQDAMDNLPISMQYILRDPDTWYISNDGKLFKAIDPETQAIGDELEDRQAEWGFDSEEEFRNSANYTGAHKATVQFLQEYKFLGSNNSEDILGSLDEQNNDFILLTPLPRIDIDINKIAIGKYGSIIDSEEEVDEESTWDEEDPIYQNYDKAGIMPTLSKETERKFLEAKELFELELKRLNTPEEKEAIRYRAELEIDKIIYHELVNGLNSQYNAFGYTPPKIRWKYVWNPGTNTDYSDAAEERITRFYSHFNQITKCYNMDQLFGKLEFTDEGPKRNGGVYGKLRELFQEDKDLHDKWSIHDIYDNNNQLIKRSSFNTQRQERYKELSDQGKDEGTIRKILWYQFDKKKIIIPAVYKEGKKIKDKVFISDSWWRQERTDAMMQLNFTSKQKAALWEATQWMKEKFKLEDNKELADKINQAFAEIKTLNTLKIFKDWLYDRKQGYKEIYENNILKSRKPNYKFSKAIIDRLSIRQTKRIETYLAKREQHIKARNIMFLKLEKLSKDNIGITTDKSEVGAECYFCGRWVSEIPKQITINSKDYLYVPCDCGKKVWLVDFKEREI